MEENFFGEASSLEKCLRVHHKRRKERQSHYRAHIASICFPEIADGLPKTSPFDMPIITANYSIPTVTYTTPFDRIRAKTANKDSIVVFYINDDRFAHRLTHPWDYTDLLKQFHGVIAPDLSQYINMDYASRLSNNYWNKVFAAHWQKQGINIYPNVTWSLPDSYEYSVAGLPRHSVIAINSMGILKYNFSIALWLNGYHYMLEKLEPICILRYGPKIDGEDESISVYLENVQLNLLRNGSKW